MNTHRRFGNCGWCHDESRRVLVNRVVVSAPQWLSAKAFVAILPLLVPASLSIPPLAASPIVQFVVYLDENKLEAFYLGSASHRTDCKPDPFGTQFQCPLDFKKDNTGVPVVSFPNGSDATPGDVLLTESNSTVPSDVIRFGKDSAQFYSDPGDANDTKTLPSTTAKGIQEMDLSLLQVALSNDSQNNLNLKGFLTGKVGSFYFAGPKDIGGSGGAAKGVGYIFVSDTDTPGQSEPEPRTMVPVACVILALSWFHRLRFRRN